MKFQTTTPAGVIRTLAEIKNALILEFKNPKSKSQSITELKKNK